MMPASNAVRLAARCLAIDRVTAEVTTAMTRQGVAAILLKGPSIATWLYSAGPDRSYVDCDLLVSPTARATAERTLATLGFVDVLSGADPSERDDHASAWQRSRDNVCVDLHRTIPGVMATEALVWATLENSMVTMSVGGETVRVLNYPARLLLVGLHAAHNGVRSRQSLRDLARAIDQVADDSWRQAADLARALDGMAAFVAGLCLVPAGARLAQRLDLPRSCSVEVRLRAMSAPQLALGFQTLVTRPGLGRKFSFVGRNLIPTTAFMRFWSPVASRGRLGLALAYAWRWLWLAGHVLPAYRAWWKARRDGS